MSTFKKKLPPKVENMTKEEVVNFLKRKRECEVIAQSLVVTLLENVVTEMNFLNCLPYLSQSHYEDVTEERAIIKLCGYPLCSKKLSDTLPAQQYKISCKTNRVYDITFRKNFCSNGCYKSSVFIKEQILSGPLWCREKEDNPNFKLLPLNTKGILGEPIDLSLVKKIDIDETNEHSFRSFLDFTEASLIEMSMDDEGKNVTIESVEILKKNEASDALNGDKKEEVAVDGLEEPIKNCTDLEHSETKEEKIELKNENIVDETKNKKKSNKISTMGKIIGDIVERKPENRIDPFLSAGQKMEANKNEKKNLKSKVISEKINRMKETKKQPKALSAVIVHIEKCLGEWFSLETMLFLFGDERVKQMVSDKGDCIKIYLNNVANGLFYKSTSYDQYQLLCRKLNLLELEDRKYDSKVTSAKELKPLPHYSMLQEESERLDIKVRAFLKGDMEMPIRGSKKEVVQVENKNNHDENETMPKLPLVDKTAQHALRRKIVLNSLNKVLPDLLQTFGLASRDVSSDVRLLVATFNLQAHNITFKPAQWSMIVIILIKLLSIRDLRLGKALEQDMASRHLQLLLMSYEQDGGYLDRLISWLTDIDRLLDSNDTQFTVDT